MTFVVKKMCYLDKNGKGVISAEQAHHHESYEAAELVASTCGGEIFKTFKPERKHAKTKVVVAQKEVTPKKNNQDWMRGAK
ncbi:hypothetical protein QJ527_07135 [Enterococcus mundtii]|uniref:hypothetical protein n=1 Tax=Enterococcus mundtii TaxID=53346 RepID=UPI002542A1B4|nr:hypothetical protein [Enterococcus mundtii]MDK4211315.1 hypothetical protein [Enterococcus mundtii]